METPAPLEAFAAQFPRNARLPEQILYLLEGATRAPSTHNSQPWRFRTTEALLEVHRDIALHLPASDSKGRYACISIGFLLHHIGVLGRYAGMRPELYMGGGTGTLVATIRFEKSGAFEEGERALAAAIFRRRNRRGLFDTSRPLPHELSEVVISPAPYRPTGMPLVLPTVVTDSSVATRIGELTKETMMRLYARLAFRREMARWITPTGSHRTDGIPGYSLNQSRVLSWVLPSVIRHFNIGKVVGSVSAAAIASAPALIAFGSQESTEEWLGIGFQASHGILSLVTHGFDASVFVASAELPDVQAEATRLCGLHEPLQFLFAAGVLTGTASWRTPRAPVADKLMV